MIQLTANIGSDITLALKRSQAGIWTSEWFTDVLYVLLSLDELRNPIVVINASPPSAAYVSVNRVSIGSGNVCSPIRHQAII